MPPDRTATERRLKLTDVIDFPSGQFRFVRGVAPYSAVVAPLVGFEIERARFANLEPLEAGFARIEAHLKQLGRPLTALCGCELRSPAQWTVEFDYEMDARCVTREVA